jgi:hypothetical protein
MLLRNRKYDKFLFKIANIITNDTEYYNIYFFILTEFKKNAFKDFISYLKKKHTENLRITEEEEYAIESIFNLIDVQIVKICIMPSCYGMTAIRFNKQIRIYIKEKKLLEEKIKIIEKKYANEVIGFIRIKLIEILKDTGFDLKGYQKICEEATPIIKKEGKDLKEAIITNTIKGVTDKKKVKEQLKTNFYM